MKKVLSIELNTKDLEWIIKGHIRSTLPEDQYEMLDKITVIDDKGYVLFSIDL